MKEKGKEEETYETCLVSFFQHAPSTQAETGRFAAVSAH